MLIIITSFYIGIFEKRCNKYGKVRLLFGWKLSEDFKRKLFLAQTIKLISRCSDLALVDRFVR